MIKAVLYKHATIGLNNGVVIDGFVQASDERYFKIVEKNNNIVFTRIDDISFIRVASIDEEKDYMLEEETSEEIIKEHSQLSNNDFSMDLPANDKDISSTYQKPIFVRKTK